MKQAMSASARMMCIAAAIAVAFGVSVNNARATFDLQITEMWPGNDPGNNLTEDWFEVTNVGDMPWIAAVDGDLYYDDDSQDASTADLMSGITQIDPGESVVFVNDSSTTEWSDLWGAVLSVPQIGTFDGSGLGQGGDGVTLFLSMGAAPADASFIIDFEAYPDANANGGQSWDVVLGAFSTVGNASGAVATTTVNDESQPAIGSPGAIPEPATLMLLATGALCLTRRRR